MTGMAAPPEISSVVPNGGPLFEHSTAEEVAGILGEVDITRAWVSDHLALVDPSVSRHPYSAPDAAPARVSDPATSWFEALTCCALLAGADSRLTVGTAVLVLTQRDPVAVAKVAATLDLMTEGRFVLGVGMGWAREESEFLGYDFGSRTQRFEQGLRRIREAWTADHLPWGSRRVYLRPRPRADMPLLIGGNSGPALRRASRFGDGWIGLLPDGSAALRDLDTALGHIQTATDRSRFRVVVRVLPPSDPSLERLHHIVGELARRPVDEVVLEPDWRDPDRFAGFFDSARRAARLASSL
jgi:alkanesulfonate monooxygenase SsuD/methylene tetrahydromethanopterin reductase-like flavin-dependent oxidoreductase (luciferase family)